MDRAELVHRVQEFTGSLTQQIEYRLRPTHAAAHKAALLKQARSVELQFHQHMQDHSEHGRQHAEAKHKPELADHAAPHFARQALWADHILLSSPELRITDRAILFAHTLFAQSHDADQLNVSHRNLQRDPEDKLNPRNGHHHEVAGALQLLAQTGQYIEATKGILTEEEARNAIKFAAIEGLFHDSQEILRPSLIHIRRTHGTKPYRNIYVFDTHTRKIEKRREILHGKELFALFEPIQEGPHKGEIEGCDLTALSPKQICELSKHFKQLEDHRARNEAERNGSSEPKHKFVDHVVTPHGLDLEFEKAFEEELQALGEDDTPLFDKLSHAKRRQLVVDLEVNVLGDQLDALLPSRMGLLRTLSNDHARRRPIVNECTATYLPYTQNVSPEGDTDLARKLRELLIIADLVEGTDLAQTSFAQRELPAMQIAYIQDLKQDGQILIRGDKDEVQSMVEEIWHDELQKTATAFAQRAGIDISEDPDTDVTNTTYVQSIMTQLYEAGLLESVNELQRLIAGLPKRVDHTVEAIFDQRKSRHHTLTKEEEIAAFKRMCDELLYGPSEPVRYREFLGYKTLEITTPTGKTQRFRPRYLAQYAYAQDFLNNGPLSPQKTQYPYDSYIHPQQFSSQQKTSREETLAA